jgi:hypothetical protein
MDHLNNQMSRLKPGQIVQGKIVKIFPNHKAQVKLSSASMIAQLEASLTIAARYHFQVKSTDRIIHLKVLGQQLKKENEINARTLLQQFGFRDSRNNIALLKGLIDKSIPFEKKDIANALQLLEGLKNKKTAIPLLQQIIANKLPVTPSVLQALDSLQTSTLSQQIQSMLAVASRETNEHRIIRLLEGLNIRPLNPNGLLVSEIIKQAKNSNRQLFSLLQFSGAINPKLDFSIWKSGWNKLKPGASQQPFPLKLPSALQGMEQINRQKTYLSDLAKESLQLWENKFLEAVTQNAGLSEKEFRRMKQQMTQLFSPVLNSSQAQLIKKMLNHPADLERFFNVLRMLSNSSTYTNADKLLNQLKAENNFLQASPKEQFLMQLSHWLTRSGIDYENRLANNRLQAETSLKGLLLHLISTGNGRVRDQAGQFLQYINGLQLNSVHESNGFLHINLQIPGEKLGLLKDIDLEFESKKTESGEINPEHCRILFYLHLNNLDETVIDMKIQKRTINVTVYNEAENPENIFDGLKNMLKKGLEELNYQLSSVQYRKLQKLESTAESIHTVQLTSKGVDYRI